MQIKILNRIVFLAWVKCVCVFAHVCDVALSCLSSISLHFFTVCHPSPHHGSQLWSFTDATLRSVNYWATFSALCFDILSYSNRRPKGHRGSLHSSTVCFLYKLFTLHTFNSLCFIHKKLKRCCDKEQKETKMQRYVKGRTIKDTNSAHGLLSR